APLVDQVVKTPNIDINKLDDILKATVINDPNDQGGNNGKTDPKKVDKYTRLFQNPKTQAWAVKMLDDGWDIETISRLTSTKQGFYVEEQNTNTSKPVDENTQFFMDFGMEEKQAAAIIKAISKNGVIDKEMNQVAVRLIQSGVANNRIAEIINSSNITGKYNSKIIEDAVKIKDLEINPLLLKNLPVLNNIKGVDVAAKFNSKVRKSLKGMIEGLDTNIKSQLEKSGFDINRILSKLDSQMVRVATNSPQPQGKIDSGMRTKSSITGFEKIVVDKYEPIEKIWRSEESCKKWAEEKYLSFKNREYISARTGDHVDVAEINKQRKEGLKQWFDFMETEPEIKDNPFIRIILAEYITKELLPENSNTPPTLDKQLVKKVLADAIKTGSVSFDKIYSAKLNENAKKSSGAMEVEIGGRKMTWYTVPKTDSSHPNFKDNAAKVRAFSDGTNWCIRTWNAEPYIQLGNIHFLVDETGLTQVCIRENNTGHIAEIQRRQQNATVPVAYIDFIQDFITKKGLDTTSCGDKIKEAIAQKPAFEQKRTILKNLIDSVAKSEERAKEARKKLKEQPDLTDKEIAEAKKTINNANGIEKQVYRQILEAMGIEVKELNDGTWEISHYSPQFGGNVLNDYGLINENKLLSNVSVIRGNADFKDSNVTSLPNLKVVYGTLDFGYAEISNLKNLEIINGKSINWH
ncbi:hypothetical protein IKQ21_03290, partial [bacterium]|nr:hypothetical protein [bacterium]